MNEQRDIELINELLANKSELPWLEFKTGYDEKKMIGKLCSALANSARQEGRDFGYVLWGVDDLSYKIVGTSFDPNAKQPGNQELQFWLAQRLKPSVPFNFKVINHPKGRVVLLEITAVTSAPIAFDGVAYIRIGSATPKLMDYPDRYQKLIECLRPFTWEHGVAKQYVTGDEVLRLLDSTSYFRLTKQPLPDNPAGIFERLVADRLIVHDVGDKWNIMNIGAILFASDLSQFDDALSRKGIRLIVYSGKNKASQVTYRQDGCKGYASGFEGLVNYINNILPSNEHIGEALRETQPLFPKLAIRELIANALIHQDMTVTGAGPQIELFEDRIEIVNPGKPLVKVDRMIDLPPRSRNVALASLMRRMGFCEEQGSGLDKVIFNVEIFQLPPPLFRESDNSMQVILYGPRTFACMTSDERIRACYHHAILKVISGERMKNATLCERFGIEKRNAAQATKVINLARSAGLIKPADPDHQRSGYIPFWA
jgi:ATP-dependent DNA helicase RecG